MSKRHDNDARRVLQRTLDGEEKPTPLLDTIDDLAEYAQPHELLDRIEATEGRVALHCYGPADNEMWLRHRPEDDQWESQSRYPTGGWSSLAAARVYAELWVQDYMEDDADLRVELVEDAPVPWKDPDVEQE